MDENDQQMSSNSSFDPDQQLINEQDKDGFFSTKIQCKNGQMSINIKATDSGDCNGLIKWAIAVQNVSTQFFESSKKLGHSCELKLVYTPNKLSVSATETTDSAEILNSPSTSKNLKRSSAQSSSLATKKSKTCSGENLNKVKSKDANKTEPSQSSVNLTASTSMPRYSFRQETDKREKAKTERKMAESKKPKLSTVATGNQREDDKDVLTLQYLSGTDSLAYALSVALGKHLDPNDFQMPANDPFCWYCLAKCEANAVGQDKRIGCQFCHLSYHSKCITLFPVNMPQMEPECAALISDEWKDLLKERKVHVCKFCVSRVSAAIFQRKLGYMTSDYFRRDTNMAFVDVIDAIKANIDANDKLNRRLQEDEKEADVYKRFYEIDYENNERIVVPMDLKTMGTKAQNGEYRSMQDFLFDARLIERNYRIFNEPDYTTGTCKDDLKKLMDHIVKEAKNIDRCPTCFRNFYLTREDLTKDFGADVPCGNPHSIVWAKYKGKYWLPAKVYEYRRMGTFVVKQDKKVTIVFFGTTEKMNEEKKLNEPKHVNLGKLFLYSKVPPRGGEKPTGEEAEKFTKAQLAVNKFFELLKVSYDCEYKIPDKAQRVKDSNLYIQGLGTYQKKRMNQLGYFTQK